MTGPQDLRPQDLRTEIPVLGLIEYWYPALPAKKIRNRPVGLKIMGEDIVFFRGASGDVAALSNTCPHRGGSLRHGDCHYRGTVACPYHGWVFDEQGECIAVLSEGPGSHMPGGVRARKYPTRTLKGLVFIWMGEGIPAPIEEDVPPEFFDGDATLVLNGFRFWPVNWRVGLENALDSHVSYVHRNAILFLKRPMMQVGSAGHRVRVVNDRACIGYNTEAPTHGRQFYPSLNATWPKAEWRRLWLWMFPPAKKKRTDYPPFNDNDEWDMHTVVNSRRVSSAGHHLPTMFRYDYGRYLYTRTCVPIDADSTRIVFYHATHLKGAFRRFLHKIYFYGLYTWLMHSNFSQQDYSVMGPQRYDRPEYLSSTDAQVVGLRRLLIRARGMPKAGSPDHAANTTRHDMPLAGE